MNVYALLRVTRKEYPRRETHLPNARGISRYVISIENSKVLYYVTDCHGPQRGIMVTCSRAGRGRQGVHPRLPLSILKFTRSEFTQSCQFCLVIWSTYPTGLEDCSWCREGKVKNLNLAYLHLWHTWLEDFQRMSSGFSDWEKTIARRLLFPEDDLWSTCCEGRREAKLKQAVCYRAKNETRVSCWKRWNR